MKYLILLLLFVGCDSPSAAYSSDSALHGPALAATEPLSAVVCRVSTGTWQNFSIPSQTNTEFTVEFDALPAQGAIDGVIGLSNGWTAKYSSQAVAVRFNLSGQIDARSGSSYRAVTSIAYADSITYHFRLVVSLVSKTYSAFVRAGAGSEQTVASNYGFRTEQKNIKRITNLGFRSSVGTLTTCYGVAEPPPEPPPIATMTALTVTPSSATVEAGKSQQFSFSATWSDGQSHTYAVTWTATGGTVTTNGLYAAGSTTGTGFRIIGTHTGGTKADTSAIAIISLTTLSISPSSVSLLIGTSQQFTPAATWNDGQSHPYTVAWSATGGTITTGGLYTAGSTAGSYRAIGASNGLADTSAITITSPVCVSTATLLCPGDNVQAKATAAGPGATLTLQPGTYRQQTVTPLTNQSFVGLAGAIMSGAKLLTGWTASGATWYVTGQTQEFDHSQIPALDAARCQAAYLSCQYAEDVYRDDVLLKRELSVGAVGPGDFYFDYAADRIYVGDNPAGHVLEGIATEYAFNGTAQGAGSGVTVKGLVIEKYGSAPQQAAVGRANLGANWIVRNNEIRFNHGIGIRTGTGTMMVDNNIHHNGQMGAGGGGNGVRFDSNTVAYNNAAHFDYGWEAGGTKFVQTQGFIARGNFAHHNDGPGLWWDGDNVGARIVKNQVEDNVADGIFWEISYGAVIDSNNCLRNGFGRTSGSEGAGILLNTSGGLGSDSLVVKNNTLVGNKNGIVALQADRGSGGLGLWQTRNVSVHDNTVQLIGSTGRHGIDKYSGTFDPWSAGANNHFEHNTYNLQTAIANPFIWDQAYLTDAEWRAAGNDVTGTFNR